MEGSVSREFILVPATNTNHLVPTTQSLVVVPHQIVMNYAQTRQSPLTVLTMPRLFKFHRQHR